MKSDEHRYRRSARSEVLPVSRDGYRGGGSRGWLKIYGVEEEAERKKAEPEKAVRGGREQEAATVE